MPLLYTSTTKDNTCSFKWVIVMKLPFSLYYPGEISKNLFRYTTYLEVDLHNV